VAARGGCAAAEQGAADIRLRCSRLFLGALIRIACQQVVQLCEAYGRSPLVFILLIIW
jgi:hypothetical protein